MILLEDTRNQIGKHKNIEKYCKEHDIEIVRTKLVVGDYMLPQVPNISIDTKKDLQEVMGNITQKRFKEELKLAKKLGIKLIVLIEHSEDIKCIEDVEKWVNPRLSQYCFQLKKQLGIWGEFNEWYLYREAKSRGIITRRPPQSSVQLMKALRTIQDNKEDYDCEFVFCDKKSTAEVVISLLNQDNIIEYIRNYKTQIDKKTFEKLKNKFELK